MSIRTLRVETMPDWLFVIEVIEVMDNKTGERRHDYATSCILCDEEVGNFDGMSEAEAAGVHHQCGVSA